MRRREGKRGGREEGRESCEQDSCGDTKREKIGLCLGLSKVIRICKGKGRRKKAIENVNKSTHRYMSGILGTVSYRRVMRVKLGRVSGAIK